MKFQRDHSVRLYGVVSIVLLVFTVCSLLSCNEFFTLREKVAWQRTVSLRVDPNFSQDYLPDDVRVWYERLWAGLNNQNPAFDWAAMALSNDTYNYGRKLNAHITSLLHVLQVTGDPALLEEVDRLTELMREQLKDWSITSYGGAKAGSAYEADGYLNWQWHWDTDDSYVGTDVHVMDEMLAHSLVASFTYAFYVNRDLDSRYAERADFWLDYLKNHFEVKWRTRNNVSTGNFLEKDLTHPYIQFVRYHFYMYKLTGEKQYLTEAQRRAKVIEGHMLDANGSLAFVWDHRVVEENNEPSWGCQPFYYGRQTALAAIDLSLQNFSIFEYSFMKKLAGTVVNKVIDNDALDFAPDVCGGVSVAGLKPSGYSREDQKRWSSTVGYVELGAWDSTDKILNTTKEVYQSIEVDSENPRYTLNSAGIIFATLYPDAALRNLSLDPSWPPWAGGVSRTPKHSFPADITKQD